MNHKLFRIFAAHMAETLKEKTAKGLFWGALNNGATQVLNIVIGILLARMLTPDEWAPIGMIAIFSAIAGNLQSSGFSTAIVNMKQPTDNDYNAVFWFNIITSFIIYWLLFALAPWIAWFFEQPCLTELSHLPGILHLVVRNLHSGLSHEEHDEPRDSHCQPLRSGLFRSGCCHPCLQGFFLLELSLAADC